MNIVHKMLAIAIAIALWLAALRLAGKGSASDPLSQPVRGQPAWLRTAVTVATVLCLLLGLGGLFLSACGGLMMMVAPEETDALLFVGVLSLVVCAGLILWLCNAAAARLALRVMLVLAGVALLLWAVVPVHR